MYGSFCLLDQRTTAHSVDECTGTLAELTDPIRAGERAYVQTDTSLSLRCQYLSFQIDAHEMKD